jgi:hypothetical protein
MMMAPVFRLAVNFRRRTPAIEQHGSKNADPRYVACGITRPRNSFSGELAWTDARGARQTAEAKSAPHFLYWPLCARASAAVLLLHQRGALSIGGR